MIVNAVSALSKRIGVAFAILFLALIVATPARSQYIPPNPFTGPRVVGTGNSDIVGGPSSITATADWNLQAIDIPAGYTAYVEWKLFVNGVVVLQDRAAIPEVWPGLVLDLDLNYTLPSGRINDVVFISDLYGEHPDLPNAKLLLHENSAGWWTVYKQYNTP